MATLTITGCIVDTSSITISFSAPMDQSTTGTGAANPENYTIYDPPAGFRTPTNPDSTWSFSFPDEQTVALALPSGTNFNAGDFVLIEISNIAVATLTGTSALIDDPVSISRQVPGTGPAARATRDVEDAIAYPVLTEEIGYRPSPVGIPVGGGGGNGWGGGGGGSSIGQTALKAVSDVLGWKANTTDPKGFVGALTQAFTLTEVEGHVESTWTPRTYAVQTDLGGGITGAQASLYMRAKDALDQSLSLLDGLYPLDPEADPEYVKALREMARSQMTEIVKELGTVGLPSVLRIDTYFGILLGQNPAQLFNTSTPVEFNPDEIQGTLGTLRNTYGIYFGGNPYNNSVEDEQDITNFRVISDYMTSLMQSWIANRDFFRLAPNNPAFFGTQLVLISRQFSVIAETVNEVRFTLDSVFIGPAERQTLLLEFVDGTDPMFLEDVLEEVEKFATDEGPRLLRDGGKISVTNNVLPVVQSLQNLVEQAHQPSNIDQLPDGFKTARVRNSLDDLQGQLEALINLTEQVEQQVPLAEDRLMIESVFGLADPGGDTGRVVIIGRAFDHGLMATIHSTSKVVATPQDIQFYSSQRIDVPIADPATWTALFNEQHEVTLANPDGASVTVTLPNGIPLDLDLQVPMFAKRNAKAGKATLAAGKAAIAARKASKAALGSKSARTGSKPATAAPPSSAVKPTPATAPSAMQNQLTQLQKSHDELKEGHKTVLQKLEGMEDSIVQKLSDVFKGKGKKDKDD
jgi:hypothetical protein